MMGLLEFGRGGKERKGVHRPRPCLLTIPREETRTVLAETLHAVVSCQGLEAMGGHLYLWEQSGHSTANLLPVTRSKICSTISRVNRAKEMRSGKHLGVGRVVWPHYNTDSLMDETLF
jgi:hypothetical protein